MNSNILYKTKTPSHSARGSHSVPGGVLLSHGEAPHYHRRIGVSLLSSVWGQVGPPLYRRQDYSFNNFFYLFLLSLSLVLTTKQADLTLKLSLSSLSFVSSYPTPKTLERCIVKPLGQLVSVSSTARTAYTPDLSTS